MEHIKKLLRAILNTDFVIQGDAILTVQVSAQLNANFDYKYFSTYSWQKDL